MHCILAFFQQALGEEFTTVFTHFSSCFICAGQLLNWFKWEQERTVSSRPHYRYSNGTHNRRYLFLYRLARHSGQQPTLPDLSYRSGCCAPLANHRLSAVWTWLCSIISPSSKLSSIRRSSSLSMRLGETIQQWIYYFGIHFPSMGTQLLSKFAMDISKQHRLHFECKERWLDKHTSIYWYQK